MKKLINVSILLLLTILVWGKGPEPKWTNKELFWEQLNKKILLKKFHGFEIFQDDIKIQLKSTKFKEDSLLVNQIIEEINPLLERVQICQVRENGNFVLNIVDTIKVFKPCDLFWLASSGGGTIKNSTFRGMFFKLNGNIENVSKSIILKCSPTFDQRKLLFQNKIIKELIGYPHPYDGKDTVKTIFSSRITSYTTLTEADRFFLYQAYSKNFTWRYITKFPINYIKFLKANFRENALWAYILFTICLVIIYLIVLIRLGLFDKDQKGWKGFVKTGMLVLQSGVIITICYGLFSYNFHVKNIPLFFWQAVFLPHLFSFLFLNIIFFAEKLLIKPSSSVSVKIYLQIFISLVVLALPFFIIDWLYSLKYNFVYACIITSYGLLVVVGRTLFNYISFKTQNTIKEKDLELIKMREMQHKAELQALHSRINPHFLYNSLNSIAGLAKADPEKTEKMALALSDFCRHAINKGDETFATVEVEASLAGIYLDIEKTRFGEKLHYSLEIAEETKGVKIPKFIIQPLIENAIKHGISKITQNGMLKLVIKMENDFVALKVYDNGPAFPDTPTKGYGLQCIFDKLELLYKGRASVNWVNGPEKCISVKVPVEL